MIRHGGRPKEKKPWIPPGRLSCRRDAASNQCQVSALPELYSEMLRNSSGRQTGCIVRDLLSYVLSHNYFNFLSINFVLFFWCSNMQSGCFKSKWGSMREEGRVISITLQFVSYKIRCKQAMDGQGSFAHTVLLSAPTASNTTHFSACLLNTSCLVWILSEETSAAPTAEWTSAGFWGAWRGNWCNV